MRLRSREVEGLSIYLAPSAAQGVVCHVLELQGEEQQVVMVLMGFVGGTAV